MTDTKVVLSPGWLENARLSLSRGLAQLLLGLWHRSDYGTQEGIDCLRRLENRRNVLFENHGYNTFRHPFGKAIRLGSAVVEPILLPHGVAYALTFLRGRSLHPRKLERVGHERPSAPLQNQPRGWHDWPRPSCGPTQTPNSFHVHDTMTIAPFQQFLGIRGGAECRPVHGLIRKSSAHLSCRCPRASCRRSGTSRRP